MFSENCLANIRKAQREIANEYLLDPVTNEFKIQLPVWVQEVSRYLHAAHDHAVNAIDPAQERPHSWWEQI